MTELKIYINGREAACRAGETVLTVAKREGVEIPTLCHDELVKPYGACGLCLVEEEGKPRLLRACSVAVMDGMRVLTESERVVRARKTVLELLLSDHTGDCRPPCMLACPAGTDCQGYVGLIANGEDEAAARLIRERLPLPSSIGRVCPHPCEEACRRELVEEPVNIAGLKFFATDQFMSFDVLPKPLPDTGKRVAVIGGGPGGLSAAYFLRMKGHTVTVFDQQPEMGGMLRYGIPEYRLPREILAKEVELIAAAGVKLRNGVKVGRDIGFERVRDEYDAVIVAIGAWKSAKLGCPGEDSPGVVGGIDFLRWAAERKAERLDSKSVAVVGGGNTAMDACRTAMRLGAENVYNIYRRTKDEMPAETLEINEALEEGVTFLNLRNPIDITESNGVLKVRLQIMELGEPDASGRRAPVPVPGAEETIEVSTVISAIGQYVDISGIDGLPLTRRGTIAADERSFTCGVPGVFAIGDAVNKGPDKAVSAIGAAYKAAAAADAYLCGVDFSFVPELDHPEYVMQDLGKEDFTDRDKSPRLEPERLAPEIRSRNFGEVNKGFTAEAARAEAARCLECGCKDFFECKLIDYSVKLKASPVKYAGSKRRARVDDSDHPYILRNPEKCVLCGLCARVCDEALGVGAFGLAGRGFSAKMVPAMDGALNATECISCGRCVAACPTGALMERPALSKGVPVQEELIPTVCPGCGAGCLVLAAVKGGAILRVLPDTERQPNCLMCERGRFGYASAKPRLKNAVVAGSNASVADGLAAASKALREFAAKHGGEAVAIAVSPALTCEEITAAIGLSRALGTNNIFSYAKDNDAPSAPEDLLKRQYALSSGNEPAYAGSPAMLYGNTAGLSAIPALKDAGGVVPHFGRSIKALVALGEAPVTRYNGLELLIVTSLYETDLDADIVIPFAAPYETSGTYLRADAKPQTLVPVITPPSDINNINIINGLF